MMLLRADQVWLIPTLFDSQYNDVMMRVMASQITGVWIVYWTVCLGSDKKTSKLRVTGLCLENSPMAGENVSIWFPFETNHFHVFENMLNIVDQRRLVSIRITVSGCEDSLCSTTFIVVHSATRQR